MKPGALTEEAVIGRRIALLYRLDAAGRMLSSNEPYGAGEAAPLAHVCLGRSTVAYALRSGLPDETAQRLSAILARLEPLPHLQDRSFEARIWESVRSVPGVSAVCPGPVYGFPDALPETPGVVMVEPGSAEPLRRNFAGLVGELPFVQPCCARLLDGEAVATCRTVRVSGEGREAGVETLPAFRRRGFGAEVTAAWGREVLARGLYPTYSTSWDNAGSLGIARHLGIVLIAVELEIE